ncbi:MAG: hypothetical protein ACTTKL_07120 [Treponema sp.]
MTVKILRAAKFAALSFFAAAVLSCNQNLLSEPDLKNSANSSARAAEKLEAPADVKASHGYLNEITVTWSAVNGAARYIVLSAASPFAEFEACGETKDGSTELKLKVSAGTTQYYAVKAVNYRGAHSPLSGKTKGSSLAKPVITEITQSEDGNAATVTWWMDNCEDDTYKNSVIYEVHCFESNKTTPVGTAVVVSGGATSAAVTGLKPKTVYYYQVDASTKTEQKKLSSDKVDAATVRRLTPDFPADFTIAKGTAKDGIALHFKLPAFVDVSAGDGSFESRPVYFKIWRKPFDASDAAYEVVADYLGTQKDTDAAKRIYKFSCVTTSVNTATSNAAGDIAVAGVKATAAEREERSAYPDYVSLSELAFTDKRGVERGVRYSYKIQSYVDGVNNAISADKARASGEGWLLSAPDFRFTADYKLSEDKKKFSEISASFDLAFTEFGDGGAYNFLIQETGKLKTGSDVAPRTVLTASSAASVRAFKTAFTGGDLSSKAGYYEYTLFVLPKDVSDTAKAYDSVKAAGKLTVTDDADALPKIEEFTVKDGYKDKFALTWTYHAGYTYSLEWKNYKPDGTETEGGSLTSDKITLTSPVEGKPVTFNHPAASGDRRKYTLKAEKGLAISKPCDRIAETLGTPKPEQAGIDYDKITVTWKTVQKADVYTVFAHYTDSTAEELATIGSGGNAVITSDAATGFTTCVITKPKGYDDGAKSGKPITFTVTAKNNAAADETKGETAAHTLGPALVNAAIGTGSADSYSITLTWHKIDGAGGYLIRRARYSDSGGSEADKADTYYYDAQTKKITVNDDTADADRIKVDLAGDTFTLKDCYKADDSGKQNAYKVNQSKISWGLPYGYAVIPLKEAGDCTFKSDSFFETDSSSKVKFAGKVADVKGAACGYGLEVKASKSKKAVNLEWNKPFHGNFCPAVYKRLAKTNSREAGEWTLLTTLTQSAHSHTYVPDAQEKDKAFEYAVRYNYNGSSPDFAPSYMEELVSVKEKRSEYAYASETDREQQNKGYVLSTELRASYGGTLKEDASGYKDDEKYYSESVSWTRWDSDEKKIAPTAAEVYIFNDDVKADWIKLASLDMNTWSASAMETLADTTIEANGTGLSLKPTSITSNSSAPTEGVLKTLRNAKHYYKIVLKRGETEVAVGEDKDIFACRQITDAELAKAAMLAFSYTFYLKQGGEADLTNVDKLLHYGSNELLVSSNSGTAWFDGRHDPSLAWNASDSSCRFDNYAPCMRTVSTRDVTFLKLTVPQTKITIYGPKNDYITEVGSAAKNISITAAPMTDIKYNNIPMNYSAELTAYCSGKNGGSYIGCLAIKRNGKNAVKLLDDCTDAEKIREFIPFQLYHDSSEHFYIKDSKYGWWPKD